MTELIIWYKCVVKNLLVQCGTPFTKQRDASGHVIEGRPIRPLLRHENEALVPSLTLGPEKRIVHSPNAC